MPRRKCTGGKIQHGNCVTKKLNAQRENDFTTLKKAKDQEIEKLSDKKRKFKTVPILNGYRLVEIKS